MRPNSTRISRASVASNFASFAGAIVFQHYSRAESRSLCSVRNPCHSCNCHLFRFIKSFTRRKLAGLISYFFNSSRSFVILSPCIFDMDFASSRLFNKSSDVTDFSPSIKAGSTAPLTMPSRSAPLKPSVFFARIFKSILSSHLSRFFK